MKKATIGMRFLALIIDSMILGILFVLTGLFTSNYTIQAVLEILFTFLYFGFTEGAMSATLGKKLCGIKVVDDSGNNITMGTAFFRAFGRLISTLILGIGFFIALFDDQNRTLHDRIAHTYVIRANTQAAPAAPVVTPVAAAPRTQAITAAKVVGVSGFFAGKSLDVPASGVVFGRESATCNLVFPENVKGVSRNHCKLEYNPSTNMFILNDLGSSYGTFKGNDARVAQGQPVALSAGAEFYLGSRDNMFQVVS